jgi:uncharacterized membrane protein (DUF373 family)
MSSPKESTLEVRGWIARAFTGAEDVVYIGLGVVLASSALTLLVTSATAFTRSVLGGKPSTIELLDRILLILLIVELLYTVQVSFREHALLPEPFLLVGLISAIRRVLLLTAQIEQAATQQAPSRSFAVELSVLTVLILVLVVSLILVRRKNEQIGAHRA